MLPNRKLLMVAYHFPPIGGSGAIRPLKLAKYLVEFGWQPVVLSVKNPDWYYAADKNLLDELSPEIERHDCRMFRSAWVYYLLNPFRFRFLDGLIRRYLFHPDEQIGWIPFAFSAASKIIRAHDISAVYSTSSPLSSHLIAYLIHKRFNIPWVADFRDEWVENPDVICPTRIHRRFHYGLEKMIAENASRIITPAPEFCRLLKKHSGCAECETFYMGFDPQDQPSAIDKNLRERFAGRFTLVFAGMFYASFRPDRLLRVINALIDNNVIASDSVRVIFVGANTAGDLKERDRHDVFEFTGFVAHKEALGYIYSADALLLLLSQDRGKNVVPSKTFEYLGSGKPILALIPSDGDTAAIIHRAGAGLVADYDDDNAIEAAFLQLHRQWQEKAEITGPDAKALTEFDQRLITKRFTARLDEMIDNK